MGAARQVKGFVARRKPPGDRLLRQVVRHLAGPAALLLASLGSARAQSPPCYSGFQVSEACIAERGLAPKVAVYQRKISEALPRLRASYKISLRIVNNPEAAGYDPAAVGDVFTEVVRNEEMRNQSFIINVTADFLEKQPELLFESSALHEVCHIVNDDLTGYHRNGANTEAAEESCVLHAVGERRYRDYLQAYAMYQGWDPATHERVLRRVKDVVLVPPPSERDGADERAMDYFRTHADGNEHFLVYNGELHDETVRSTRNSAGYNPERLAALIKTGRPLIFFHNHPAEDAEAAMFPSHDDFAVAGFLSFMVYKENPGQAVDFRVLQLGKEDTVVSYGFKGTALADIQRLALEYRGAAAVKADDVAGIEMRRGLLDSQLADESFNDYLQYACPVDLARHDAEVCRTHPQYFIWPSDRFFIHDRPR
jgi:hypothetical protein